MAEKAEIVLSAKDTTQSAFQSVNRQLDTLKASIAGFTGGAAFELVSKGAELLGDAFSHIDPSSVFEAADALDKLSQRTGIAVEDLGALTYQGKLLGVSQDDLATSLKRLNVNIAAAAAGEEKQAGVFKAMGIAVKDASGNVRNGIDVVGDIAEKFSGYADGANKVALANGAGGRSFETLIPLLNRGRDGISDARQELDKFGATISADLAAKSKAFEENLTKLGVASSALKVSLASGLIDNLVAYSDKAVEAAKAGDLLSYSLTNLAELQSRGAPGLVGLLFHQSDEDKVKSAQKDIAGLTAEISKLQGYLEKNPGAQGVAQQIQFLTEQLRAAKAALDAAKGDSVGGGRGSINPLNVTPDALAKAPALPKTGGTDEAEAVLRKQLAGRLKAIQEELDKEKDLYKFQDAQFAEQFAHGDTSIETYYAARQEIISKSLDAEYVAFVQADAALAKFQAQAKKPQDVQDALNKRQEGLAKITKAEQDAGQAAQVASVQQDRATELALKGLLELDAQISELGGDTLGAGLDRNAIRIEELQKQLNKTGGDPAREAALRKLLDTQVRFNAAQEESARITDREATAEETIGIAADRSGKSRLEAEAAIKSLREGAIDQLDAQIAAMEALTGKTAAQELELQKLKNAREKAFDAKDPGLLEYRKVIDQTGDDLANGFADAISGGKKLSDVFKEAEQSLIKLLAHDFLTAPLATSLENWLKDVSGIGGQKAGGVGGGDLFSWLGGLFGSGSGGGTSGAVAGAGAGDYGAWFAHAGGLVGSTSGTGTGYRSVNPAVFAGAERYHMGGIAGLGADEVPAILKRREEVITPSDPRHRDNVAANAKRPIAVTNVFHLATPTSMATQSQIALQAGRGIQRVMARDA